MNAPHRLTQSGADYFGIDAVNWSSLKWMRESPAIYHYRLHTQHEDNDALRLGRAVHSLVFEPEKFGHEYAIWTGGIRRGKEWDEFKADHDGLTILREQDADRVSELADAIRRHPLVAPYLLETGLYEHPVRWTDAATGLPCKARPDWILAQQRILIDLKTTVSVDGRRFGAIAARFGYHCQLAHYAAGIEADMRWKPERVLIVAVEKEPPYDLGVFELDDEALYAGAEEVAELLLKVASCRRRNEWPGRYQEEQALQLPAWMFTEDEDGADPESLGITVNGG